MADACSEGKSLETKTETDGGSRFYTAQAMLFATYFQREARANCLPTKSGHFLKVLSIAQARSAISGSISSLKFFCGQLGGSKTGVLPRHEVSFTV
jgi:hypothetical protein